MTPYTTTEFAASIRRELKLRQEAYTRIALKAEKKFLKEAEEQRMTYAEAAQYVECKQYELLDDALRAIEHGQPLDAQHAHAILMELHREMKCRKSYYGFLVWKKRLDKETADYEKAVWAALIEHWKEEYCTPARDDWYFDTGKLGYQDF